MSWRLSSPQRHRNRLQTCSCSRCLPGFASSVAQWMSVSHNHGDASRGSGDSKTYEPRGRSYAGPDARKNLKMYADAKSWWYDISFPSASNPFRHRSKTRRPSPAPGRAPSWQARMKPGCFLLQEDTHDRAVASLRSAAPLRTSHDRIGAAYSRPCQRLDTWRNSRHCLGIDGSWPRGAPVIWKDRRPVLTMARASSAFVSMASSTLSKVPRKLKEALQDGYCACGRA